MDGNMAGAQNKRNSPGAFRSSLIPYKNQIFTWWFDDRKSAREIQTLLAEQFGLEVHWSTITRFIKVRSRKTDPHERPAHLMTFAKETSSSHISRPSESVLKTHSNNRNRHAEGERLLQILKNSTPQELGRMADEALERKKKK